MVVASADMVKFPLPCSGFLSVLRVVLAMAFRYLWFLESRLILKNLRSSSKDHISISRDDYMSFLSSARDDDGSPDSPGVVSPPTEISLVQTAPSLLQVAGLIHPSGIWFLLVHLRSSDITLETTYSTSVPPDHKGLHFRQGNTRVYSEL